MSSDLRARIQDDLKDAMRAKDKARIGTLRLVTAALKQVEVDQRIDLADGDVLTVLQRMLKQRRDSLQQYQAAGRGDLADQEAYEIACIEAYLPQPLSDTELTALIDEAIAETGAAGMKDMGRVMGLLKDRVAGRADMGSLSTRVKQRLA